ncbi:sensor domain-containing diguanylate cyclase [Acuticoccus mangrovi]|uniref:GGDEF domain-containing protein n=1 Tax=Acuticoccus mangrovi TaxID=2796142 RepID=A0A934MH79_9HYPH|nr:sensor domain-containing diguanylate cyclase [Acuticoccus mangrovi]MBJ3775781.1 GGDEF domain-containing protein [Acuticoccus mangrovi]
MSERLHPQEAARARQTPVPWGDFWRVFPLLALVPIGILWLYADWISERRYGDLLRAERIAVSMQVAAVSRGLRDVSVGVCTLAEQNELGAYLESPDPKMLAAIANEYRSVARHGALVSDVHLLDKSGSQLVHVLRMGAGEEPRVMSTDELQQLSDAFYDDVASAKRTGELFVSPLKRDADGKGVTIRFGTPVFSEDGGDKAMVVIGYNAAPILDSAAAAGAASLGVPIIMDSDGMLLITPDIDGGIGFGDPADPAHGLALGLPDEWRTMANTDIGSVRTEAGLFTFEAYRPLADLKGCEGDPANAAGADGERYRWVVASHVPDPVLDDIREDAYITAAAIGAPILLLLAVATRTVGVIVGNRRIYRAELEAMARRDALTGLANRIAFEEALTEACQRAEDEATRFAVIFMDLDGFKGVNDALGHFAGDLVLRRIARLLSENCRDGDTAARVGGDEFVVLMPGADHQGAHGFAERVKDRVIAAGSPERPIGVSIGIAIWPDDGGDAETIVVRADQAMYEAKRAGKNTIRHASATGVA